MTFDRKIFWILLVVLLPQSYAFAEADDGDTYLTVMASYFDDDKKRDVEDGFRGAQLGVGHAFSKYWNLEGVVSQFDLDGTPGQKHFSIGADIQFVLARDSRFSPYIFAGLAHLTVDDDGTESNGTAQSVGIGFRADLSKSSPASLQVEYRLREDDALGPDMDDDIFSVGLHYPFGRKSVAMPAPAEPVDGDSDGDGVSDSRDRCPDTPSGVAVDASGCPLDSDGDGVADYMDECPNTVRGATVDEKGCELDGDGDGIVDRLDECPDTRAGAQVDIVGCEIREEIQLRGVNFETNSDRLVPGAESILNNAAASLVRNPSIKVEVAGHTDSDGAAEYNQGLSARRAATVRDYLMGQGVSADRMTTRGYGESQPIADNATAAGKAENRRVVLTITER